MMIESMNGVRLWISIRTEHAIHNRLDADLRRLHQQYPMIVWDDHGATIAMLMEHKIMIAIKVFGKIESWQN